MNHQKKFYTESTKEIKYCGSSLIILTGGIFKKPQPIKPTETKHKITNCDNCKGTHELLVKQFTKSEYKFPNCCESHKKLFEFEEFYVGDFKGAGEWCANKIMYSYNHFLEWLDNDNWYNEIVDYLEYAIHSYGAVPLKCGEPFQLSNYFNCLIKLIKDKRASYETKLISNSEMNQRVDKIISYLSSYYEENEEKIKSMNILLVNYNKWFELFPFELDYFKHLKEEFSNKYPVFNGYGRYNKYMNAIKKEYHTTESLSSVLLDITNKILSTINTLSLYEKGEITNVEKTELNIILEKRKFELKRMTLTPNENRTVFIKTLKKWYKDEKEFISEIKPFLIQAKENKKVNNTRPNRTDIAYYIHYLEQTKSLELKNPFPSDKAWEEIGNEFKKNSKNIQQVYNLILSKDARLKKTKKTNISYVISNMLNKYPNALKLAKDELKLLELNS